MLKSWFIYLFIYLFYKVAFDQGMHCLHKDLNKNEKYHTT